jgi:uncharacterized protein (TIGR03435 family)
MNGKARVYQLQLRAPVTDATGLTSQYEINLYWVTDAGLRAAGPAGGGAGPQADVDAGPTLVQAVQNELGLRLVPQKGQGDFLVIDHSEKVPTEN